MDPSHPQWDEFIERLSGPEGCNFREDSNGKLTWSWKGGELARAILAHYDVDVEVSLQYCREHGGYCDCEIILNVDVEESEP